LRKGDLKFTLNGYKLKGSWARPHPGTARYLSADMPDLWVTRRPASGDATGRKLREII